jgi:hypothetical protein
MALERIVKANFVPPGYGPKFKVYDYWYNVVVDYLNGITTSGITTTMPQTVSITDYGDGKNFVTVLTLTNFIIAPLPAAAAAKVLVTATPICAFPAGTHLEEVYYQSISLKCIGDTVNADLGLGSVVGDGTANATLNLSAAGTEDRLTGQTVPTDPVGGAVTTALANTTAGVQTGIALNVAASVKNVFLNAAGTWHANNTGNLYADGIVILKWTKIHTV